MNLRFWLSVAFLISRIGVFEAALQCQTAEYSIGGMFLRGHTFKTCKIEGMKAAISGVLKKSPVKATISSLIKTSAN